MPKGKRGFQKGHTINKGISRSLETRKKYSEAKKGKTSPMKGKTHSNETRLKMSLSSRGEKCIFWKGGVSKKNNSNRDIIMTSIEYKLWRKACMERDNFTCQKTGISGGKLEVHHIHNFADYPLLRTSIENGVTLSQESHKQFHKLYGRNNNTKEQLDSFLQKDNLVVNF